MSLSVDLSKVGRTRVESKKNQRTFVGMGWKVDEGVVSVYQTKIGLLSPRFSKTRVIRVSVSLSVSLSVEFV